MYIMTLLRPLFGFCLALMLALTSVTTAQARHYGSAAQSVVICAGGMAQTVALDANGKRLPFTHNCPDCIMAAVDVPAAFPLPQQPSLAAAIVWSAPRVSYVQTVRLHADARGPPFLM